MEKRRLAVAALHSSSRERTGRMPVKRPAGSRHPRSWSIEPVSKKIWSECDDVPFDGDDVPFDGDDVHFDGDDVPFDGDDVHFDGDDVPFDGDDVLFDGDDVPFDGDDVPFDGDDVPFGGDDFHFDGDDFHFGGDDFPFESVPMTALLAAAFETGSDFIYVTVDRSVAIEVFR